MPVNSVPTKKYGLAFTRDDGHMIYYVNELSIYGEAMTSSWSRENSDLILVAARSIVEEEIKRKLLEFHKTHSTNSIKRSIGTICKNTDQTFSDDGTLASALVLSTPLGKVITVDGKFVVLEVEIKVVAEVSINN